MADLSVTAASVLPSTGTPILKKTAAATMTAGQVLAVDADKNLILGDADGSALAKVILGISVNGGASGQPVNYVTEDPDFAPGFTCTSGVRYYVSATPGGICPTGDVATGMAVTLLGIGKANGKLNLKIVAGGTL